MTHVDIYENGDSVQFIFRGHANYAEAGQDIVCAGISALSNLLQNLVNGLAEDGLISNWIIQERDGFVHVFFQTGREPAIETMVDVYLATLRQYAEQYQDHVSIRFLS